MFEKGVETNEVEWTGKTEIRRVDFLSLNEVYKNIIWAAPGYTEGTFENFGFSVDGTLISASAIIMPPQAAWKQT